MTHENSSEKQQPDETVTLACDATMCILYERSIFGENDKSKQYRGIVSDVNNFTFAYRPQSYDSFIPVAQLLGSMADFMYEPGDNDLALKSSLVHGLSTGLYVAHTTYNGVMDVNDVLTSIQTLCIADEQGRTNINQLVGRLEKDTAGLSPAAQFVLENWRKDYNVAKGQEIVFDAGFAMALAGANEKALDRHMKKLVSELDWDSLLRGDE